MHDSAQMDAPSHWCTGRYYTLIDYLFISEYFTIFEKQLITQNKVEMPL